MLIYHRTDDKLQVTQVILSGGPSKVDTFDKAMEDVPNSHKGGVRILRNGGDVYVTGGTYSSAVYSGKREPRSMFLDYISKG